MNSNRSLGRTRVARGGVLVLGGGFAGRHVARELGPSGATIVEPRRVGPRLRAICPHADLMTGSVVGLDAGRRLARIDAAAGRLSVAYAELVVALGSGVPAQLGLPLDGRGRVRVDCALRVWGAPNIWALGDSAAVPNEQNCQHPLCQATRLAHHLRPERTDS